MLILENQPTRAEKAADPNPSGGATQVSKRFVVAMVAILAMGLTAFAGSALALPTYTTACTGCHSTSDAALTIQAVAGTQGKTTTPYTITVANPYSLVGWAVFQGSTKVAGDGTTGGQVVLTNGVTYTVYAACLDGSSTKVSNSISVTPPVYVPVPDTTAPITTSDAKATYVGSASIKLNATDGVDGSGVTHTYYILDAGTQAEGTTVNTSIVGTHTLEFWSVDASNNVETPHHTVGFEVTSAPPVPVVTYYSYTYKFNLKHKVYKKLKAVLTSKTTGKSYTVTVSKKGIATWKSLKADSYKLSTKGNAKFKFKARTIRIGSTI
jgi:hypothetical protein